MINFPRWLITFCLLITWAQYGCSDDDSAEPRVVQDLGCESPVDLDYLLPYPIGEAYTLVQGNCGSQDHINNIRYAFDFAMPIGSVVTAAQDGNVFMFEEGVVDGDRTVNRHNILIIAHFNGTFGRYLHLKQDGVLVELGQEVLRGDTIALSGDTGFVREPLLHFDVVDCMSDCGDFHSVPAGFMNAQPPVKGEMVEYLAVPF